MEKTKIIIATVLTATIAIGGISAIASGNFMKNRKMEHKKPEITVEQKKEMKAKFKERLDSALADGKITQEQYDKCLENSENGKFGFGFGRGMNRGRKPENMPERKEFSEEQKAQMKEEMKTKFKERLDSALADGKITQEQYDKSLADIENGKFGFGFGRGMNRGRKPENMPERKEFSEEQKTKMKEEMKAKAKERLGSALADGKITQEQYDKSLADIEEGKFGFGFGRGKGMGKGNMPHRPGHNFKNNAEE